MLFSRDWLKQYVELPAEISALADGLTAVGLAVEGVEERDDDVLLDVDVTTNRPDCMNHLGLAREVAVHWDRELALPDDFTPGAGDGEGGATADAVRVELADPEGCPRYVARLIRGVTVGPSPGWLRRRLESVGLRPINNVVDVTNFVLWETGQPLHAFDLNKVGGAQIVVRRAAAGERLVTLDEEERELTPEVLVIADAERPVALAGIMGGLDSEVTSATTDVLLESAHFDPRRVRIGARALDMHTDASHRFERGADPGVCRAAADRAAALLAELAGGEVAAGAVDARADGFAERFAARGRLDHSRLERFVGDAVAPADAARWMTALGFTLEREDDGGEAPVWRVDAPSWRYYDMQPDAGGAVQEQDLFEEVLRHHGYDPVPARLPAMPGSDGPRTPQQVRRDRVRDHLAACGYAEAINYAFQSRQQDAALSHLTPPDGDAVPLVNPLSEHYAVLRRSLVPNLVANARFNRRRGVESVRLFEVGHLFWRPADGAAESREAEAVALLCGGTVGTPWDRTVELDLFDLKGVVESLGAVLGTPLDVRPAQRRGLVAGASAEILVDGEVVGWFGQVDEAEADYALYAGELLTAPLGTGVVGGAAEMQVRVPSRLPGIAADYTLTHAREVPWADVAALVRARRSELLTDFGLKDRYEGEGVPEGAVNTTIRFAYSHPQRTLTQEEVNAAQDALTGALESELGFREGEG